MAPTTISHALVLPIAPAHWPPPRAAVEIDGVQLEPKAELHVTLVGRALGAEMHATFGDRADALVAAPRDAPDWDLERRDDWLVLRKPLSGHGRAAISPAPIQWGEPPEATTL